MTGRIVILSLEVLLDYSIRFKTRMYWFYHDACCLIFCLCVQDFD